MNTESTPLSLLDGSTATACFHIRGGGCSESVEYLLPSPIQNGMAVIAVSEMNWKTHLMTIEFASTESTEVSTCRFAIGVLALMNAALVSAIVLMSLSRWFQM